MKSNKWSEIQKSSDNCPKCTNFLTECKCPKKQGGGNNQGSNAVQNDTELDSKNINSPDTEQQLKLSLRDPNLKPSDEFLLRFTPESRKTKENEEDEENSKDLGTYAALVPFKQIVEEFEKYLKQIANEQGLTVDQLKEQGYGHTISGHTLTLQFADKIHAQTFAQMMVDKGFAKKLEPEAEAQHQQDNSEENTESTAPSPFGRPGRIPELTPR